MPDKAEETAAPEKKEVTPEPVKLEPSVRINPGRPERKPVTGGQRFQSTSDGQSNTPAQQPQQPTRHSTPHPQAHPSANTQPTPSQPSNGGAPGSYSSQPGQQQEFRQHQSRFDNDRNFRQRRDFREHQEAPIDPDSLVACEGVLEVMPDGFGFLRSKIGRAHV